MSIQRLHYDTCNTYTYELCTSYIKLQSLSLSAVLTAALAFVLIMINFMILSISDCIEFNGGIIGDL